MPFLGNIGVLWRHLVPTLAMSTRWLLWETLIAGRRLDLPDSPRHVSFFIVTIVVDPVDRMAVCHIPRGSPRARPNFGIELFKGLKSNLDAPAAVIFPARGFGVAASLEHCLPCS